MKAYKVFDKDLTCRGFQYEIGKTCEMRDEPIICKKGFHACTELDDVFGYYKIGKNIRICEVELLGDIDDMSQRDSKVATNKIKIIRELKVKDLLELGGEKSLVQATVYGSSLITNEMIQNLSELNRMRVARVGRNRHRNCLVYDKSHDVRFMLAKHGTHKHRDILVNDVHVDVRKQVAQHGTTRHNDILVNDDDWKVRKCVAEYGNNKHRDILMYDRIPTVRETVARWGTRKHRKILKDDIDRNVQLIASLFS